VIHSGTDTSSTPISKSVNTLSVPHKAQADRAYVDDHELEEPQGKPALVEQLGA